MTGLKVGSIIIDNGKTAFIDLVLERGVLKDDSPLSLEKTFQIRYFDGHVSVIKESKMERLIEEGKIQVIAY